MIIYALKDPRTDVIRYVGRTENLEERSRAHSAVLRRPTCPADIARIAWIAELRSLGMKPIVVVLSKCRRKDGDQVEAQWIRHHMGPQLFNVVAFVAIPRNKSKRRAFWQIAKAAGTTAETVARYYAGKKVRPEIGPRIQKAALAFLAASIGPAVAPAGEPRS